MRATVARVGEIGGGDGGTPARNIASLGAFGRGLLGGKEGGGRGLLVGRNGAKFGGVKLPQSSELNR